MTTQQTGVYGCDCGKAIRLREGSELRCPACGAETLTLLLQASEGEAEDENYETAGDPYEDLKRHIYEQADAELVTPVPDTELARVRAVQSVSLDLAVWVTEYYEPVYRDGRDVGLAMTRYEYTLGEVVR